MLNFRSIALSASLLLSVFAGAAQAQTTPAEQIAGYVVASGQPAQATRGQQFFSGKHGKEWSCSSCHTANPAMEGKHASTGKVIAPMAPAANPKRFTDAAKTEKWFRRNCNDVLGRECTPGEKADFITWLVSIKP
jgi:cytochrome c peroxidase